MIKKIRSISNLAVFQNFQWDQSVTNSTGVVQQFKTINILYGRNYSGKTTLSRLLRAFEIGKISDKYDAPEFNLEFSDGSLIQNDLDVHNKKIRVFNEDFVRENLRFISDSNQGIESFAVLGEGNNLIEEQIKEIEKELGFQEKGNETGLYAKLSKARKDYKAAESAYSTSKNELDKQLSNQALDKNVGIKYKPERFGDQNYTVRKLEKEIQQVLDSSFIEPSADKITASEKLISEQLLSDTPKINIPKLEFEKFLSEARNLLAEGVSESKKIEELVNNAILHRWVKEGRTLHKGRRNNCALCGSEIEPTRWLALESHFDEMSEKIEQSISFLINKIEKEKDLVVSVLTINKSFFYSKFHDRVDQLSKHLTVEVDNYNKSLDQLIDQLNTRKDNILHTLELVEPESFIEQLTGLWKSYSDICIESDDFSNLLEQEQKDAKNLLRLNEISKFLMTINYKQKIGDIETKSLVLAQITKSGKEVADNVYRQEALVLEKKRQLNDEEKGAKKVNEYLNNYFGHQFLSLQAIESEQEGEVKQIYFEVVRNGVKAHHLSEGEQSLLAFCYFMAKLEDIDTHASKPIIWIDDPISSLDSNHIFFVYSLIREQIVANSCFEQLFISTHNLEFLKYLKKVASRGIDGNGEPYSYEAAYFVITRNVVNSNIEVMPKYLKDHVTEFNYLFNQIYLCSKAEVIDDSNYAMFYNFGNNTRKFFEIYLFYKYPSKGMNPETLGLFFGGKTIPAVLADRINNEYSHLAGVFERGAIPIDVPEMKTSANAIIERLKEIDPPQFESLRQSIGVY